jgi:acetylornithine/N-succinyldiaminopimelate aminotransferase
VNSLNSEWSTRWNLSINNNYGTPTITLDHGKGSQVWDVEGARYVDMLAGIATNILGHANSELNEAITAQAMRLTHVSNFYGHENAILLAEKLKEISGDPGLKVFYCNSGAEANEAALKIARLTGRRKIVSTAGAFHGRTMGSLSLTGQPAKQKPFKPLLPGVKYISFNDFKAAKRAINSRVAALIVEPIQGENGVVVPDFGYLKALRELTKDKKVLLVFDCVQTGMGRTGTWFGYENEGITPDIVTLAKGIGGGLPLGAMLTFSTVEKNFAPGDHGSTFGGNPIATCAARAVIKVIENESLLAKAKDDELFLKLEISKSPIVEKVRGSGLLLGIVLKQAIAKDFVDKLRGKGILANAATEQVIRIAPALNIQRELLSEFVIAFREVATSYER